MKVFGIFALDDIGINFLQLLGYLTDFTATYRAAVYLGNRGDMSRRTGKKTLISTVKLHSVNMPFNSLDAQFRFRQLDYLIAGNPYQGTIVAGRGYQLAADKQKDILAAALGNITIRV